MTVRPGRPRARNLRSDSQEGAAISDVPLSPEAPDVVEVGLDASGTVLSANEAAGMFFGADAGALVGRDLFRDLAPALNTPACRGRFLNGVRAGALAEDFTVVFGRETGALHLRIAMGAGAPPASYRVEIAPFRIFLPSRQREAMLAVDHRSRAEEVDPIVCEQEPIQTPGSIQPPHGLLAADPETLLVTVASENIAEVLGPDAAEPLGRPLSDILPEAFVDRLRRDLARDHVPRGVPERRDAELGSPPRPFAVMVHQHDGRLLLEFEAAPVDPTDFGAPRSGELRAALNRLRRENTVVALSQAASDIVQAFTGYERVLVYRFDDDWNGEAVAESLVGDWGESLLGLRFPSSDIPRQARELYTRSPTRVVVDRDAAPVPLVGSRSDNRTVDLTYSTSRSLSPVHIEYQRNLGVNGSMSVAIMTEGRLWGLMIGHHRRPHYIAPETRDAVNVVVETLALRILDLEREAVASARERTFEIKSELLEKIARADDLVAALTAGSPRLTDLFGATGAAVVIGDEVSAIGETPPADIVMRLAAALRDRGGDRTSRATNHLGELLPELEPYAPIASGALAAFMDRDHSNLLVWFRPELVQQVTWGGNPNKPVLADLRSSAVLPRRSFERWVEVRRGTSRPWAAWEQERAENLARAAQGVARRASRRFLELSAKQDELLAVLAQKERLLEDKDILTREIDHRVKNSLQIVSAFLHMQSRKMKDPDARDAFNDSYGRVMSIARVHDSLYQSETVTDVDLGQTIETLCEDLAGVGGERRELDLVAERGLMVPYRKAVALCLIATELVTNAWKYAYPDQTAGIVEVLVGRHGDDGLKLRVCDQGKGLPPDWESRGRKGLGMQLIRSMLAQIDATLHVESNQGACFTVQC